MIVLLPDVACEIAARDHDARLAAEAEARRVAKEEAWAEAYLSGEIDLEVVTVGYGSGGLDEHITHDLSVHSCRALEEMEVEIETMVSWGDDIKCKAKAVVVDDGPCDPLLLPKGSFVVSVNIDL
jgi:hypothetical protein